MYKYHAIESLRKSGAPEDKIDEISTKLDEVGKPIRTSVQELLSVVQEDNEALTESVAKHVKILEHFVERNTQSEEDESSEDLNNDEDSALSGEES
jgi:gas vesicle protein